MSTSTSLPQLIRMPVIATGLIVAALGFHVELVHGSNHTPVVEALVELFSLSYEQNLPTWWATCLLFSAGRAQPQNRAVIMQPSGSITLVVR